MPVAMVESGWLRVVGEGRTRASAVAGVGTASEASEDAHAPACWHVAGMLVCSMEPGTPTGLGLMPAGFDGMVLLPPGRRLPVGPNRASS